MLLIALLGLEGLGGLLVTLLNVVTSRALGQDFLPWESAVIPAAFGALCLVAAFGIGKSAPWGKSLVAVSQVLVAVTGVIALLEAVTPVAWVVLGLGLSGLLLVGRIDPGHRRDAAA